MGTADLGTSAESLSLLLNSSSDALLVIDVQQDFCLPTGSLYAADGDDGRQGIDSESTLPVLPAIFSLISTAHNHNITIVSTQDWHPPTHSSFSPYGGPWPVHCIQGSAGADFPPGFPIDAITHRILKGTEVAREAYSGFQGSTSLFDFLKGRGIERVFIVGYCTEYCVKATAMDSLECGFDTYIVSDLVVPVNRADGETVKAGFVKLGIEVVESKSLAF